MRPIRLARLDKVRPALVLTRAAVRSHRQRITVAPITSTVRGLATEVPVGRVNGLDHDSVVSCDNIQTIRTELLGRQIGLLLAEQEAELVEAIRIAFDLDEAL
ncbi:MAG: type II toxin-antitoxin system PemK/MazF family toxin [Micromonosporaceae bacterium]